MMSPDSVSYDQRSLLIGGKRFFGIGASVHYWRVDPQTWECVLERLRCAGINYITTYVFWGEHERKRGVYDFSGWLDLARFLKIAHKKGLYVVLRIGPYICAEVALGGLPLWLREIPGLKMRTNNEPFREVMGEWVVFLVKILMHGLFYPHGPIIAYQLENEYNVVRRSYGEDAQGYLEWIGQLAQDLGLTIPCIMCEGGPEGVLNTVNAFYPHEKLQKHFAEHPDQPGWSTELWSAWYGTWGNGIPIRSIVDLAYAVARFVAAGGTAFNYYMGIGGFNLRNTAMFLQPPVYYRDALLDPYGRTTPKLEHLSKLHISLLISAPLILESDCPVPQVLGPEQMAWIYGQEEGVAFVCNDASEPVKVEFWGDTMKLAPRSVVLVGSDRLIKFNTAEVASGVSFERTMQPSSQGRQELEILWRRDSRPSIWPQTIRPVAIVDQPQEQLQFTQNQSPCCWYRASFRVPGGPGEGVIGQIMLMRIADLAYVFVDGQLLGWTKGPLPENRGAYDTDAYRQDFPMILEAGEHTLEILCFTLGLPKGDWQMGHENMAGVRSGLWGNVYWQKDRSRIKIKGWQIYPQGLGECQKWYGDDGANLEWIKVNNSTQVDPLSWVQLRFKKPEGNKPLALDLDPMTQGILWVNSQPDQWFPYWLIRSRGGGEDWVNRFVLRTGLEEPTERYYPLPSSWLQAGENTVTIFEILGGKPSGIKVCQWVKK